jgi:ketopantoate reductase
LRVLVVGAGRVGSKVLLQLRKNPAIKVFTIDPREEPQAVQDGIIDAVDHRRELTPRDLKEVVSLIAPDLVLVTTSAEDIGHTGIPGLDMLVEALRGELEATAGVPIIAVSRTSG